MPSTTSAERTATAQVGGPLTVELDIPGDAEVTVIAVSGLDRARATLEGPAEIRRDATFTTHGSTWSIRLPEPPTTGVDLGHGARVINVGRGQRVVGNVITGSVNIGGGATYVNGVRVDGPDVGSVEPVRLRIQVPETSALRSQITAGWVVTRGRLGDVEHESASADLTAETVSRVQAQTVSGDIDLATVTETAALKTTSGDIVVDSARGPLRGHTVSGFITARVSAAAQAKATSGDIRLHAAEQVHITARAVSGDVTVSAASGVRPVVEARSTTGRVRTP